MRRFTKLQRRLIVLNLCILLFACLMLSLRQNTISNMGYSMWTYLKYGLLDKPLDSFGNAFEDFANLWHVYEDNEYLNEQLANQQAYETLYQAELNKNMELSDLLDLKNANSECTQVAAEVVSRPVSSWNQSVTISAGSNENIQPSMLVCSSQGAVGIVSEVQESTATVALLTGSDVPNDLTVMISMDDGSSAEGVLRGYDAETNRYSIVLFDSNASVSEGQKIVTSGKGGNFPSGLLVGTVTKVQMNDDALISTVYASPVSNIGNFSYVSVMGSGVVQP